MIDDKQLEHKMEMRQRAPFWWPDIQSVMQLFLAAAIVSMVGYILTQLLSGEALKIDPSVRDLIVFIFGIIFGNFKDVYGFTYGSSASDKMKGEVISRSMENKDKTIAAGVERDAAKDGPKIIVSWWSLFAPEEQAAIVAAAPADARVQAILTALQAGKAEAPDIIDLVTRGLLTQARADVIQTAQ